MNQETLWQEFSSLSPQVQMLVLEFIVVVKQYSHTDPSNGQDGIETLKNIIADPVRIGNHKQWHNAAPVGGSPSGSPPSDKLSLANMTYDPNEIPIWELVAQLSATVPEEEWAKLPTDLARNFDHYQQ